MNDVIYHIACFMIMREPTVWRWSHTRHHTDTIIVGVNQAQRVGSDVWWRAELQETALAAAAAKRPKEERRR